ncbi:MAG: hypothetical protein NW200_00825 [Hyphomonadaceae bacterium]|nr:hypothetical protein [Hyphomonadaceae bacterium]
MSMTKTLFAAAAALGLFAGVALADTAVVAKLAAPTAEGRVIASGVVWQCAGDTCQARVTKKVSARVCMELAREVGQITSFGNLGEADIARCNSRAAAPATTAVAAN